MNDEIILFDPSLRDNDGKNSTNLGDVIIYRAVRKVLEELFPSREIIRVSTHVYPGRKEFDRIRSAGRVIVGGTNLLSSHIRKYNQWKLHTSLFRILFPAKIRAVLMGVGWWQYQDCPDRLTRRYYRMILDPGCTHAVRDSYTLEKMKAMGFHNVLNTSCPTIWHLDGSDTSCISKQPIRILFTLTDYSPDPKRDTLLIGKLLASGAELFFFPQGTKDELYLKSLDDFKKNADRINILPRNLTSIIELKNDAVYIGTRLHVGIFCMAHRMPSLILAIDNRATEMANDIRLPVIKNADAGEINAWLRGELRFGPLSVPVKQIANWKLQFRGGDDAAIASPAHNFYPKMQKGQE